MNRKHFKIFSHDVLVIDYFMGLLYSFNIKSDNPFGRESAANSYAKRVKLSND